MGGLAEEEAARPEAAVAAGTGGREVSSCQWPAGGSVLLDPASSPSPEPEVEFDLDYTEHLWQAGELTETG